MDQYLKNLYYNDESPASFSSKYKIYQQSKKDGRDYTLKEIEEWLEQQELYTVFKPFRIHIDRPVVIVPYYGYQFDGDTIFLKKWAAQNMKYSYIMLIIDIFTRYVWTIPMRSLLASESVSILTEFFKKNHCEHLRSDNGPEWRNKLVQNLLKKEKISQILTRNSEIKANFAERAIQTIRQKLTKNLYFEQSHRWIDNLQNVTHSYNHTYHGSIKMTPFEATKADSAEVWANQYLPPKIGIRKSKVKKKKITGPKKFKYKFNIGDTVRISGVDHAFRRHYDEKWSQELFIIVGRDTNQGFEQYTIKSWANELIKGSFFKQELQKVEVDLDTVYKIETIVKRRTRNKQREVLVRWLGWPKKYDSWIPEKEMKDIKNAAQDV